MTDEYQAPAADWRKLGVKWRGRRRELERPQLELVQPQLELEVVTDPELRTRRVQLLEDRTRYRLDTARRYGMADATLDEYGRYVAQLAPWRWFVTLTHRMPDGLEVGRRSAVTELGREHRGRALGDEVVMHTGASIVGVKPHRRDVRRWFYDVVRPTDRTALWWSEAEEHKSGSVHEHGLLACSEVAPHLMWRTKWFELAGYCYIAPVTRVEGAAVYVAKYTGKAAAVEPCVYGFGRRALEVDPGSFAARAGVRTIGELEDIGREGVARLRPGG